MSARTTHRPEDLHADHGPGDPEGGGRPLLPIAAPSRRTLLLGVGTLGAGLTIGMGSASAAPLLRKGSRGSAVTGLQRDLARLEYWCGAADGSFGHLTQQAVFALQKVAGLSRDGVVGPKTYRALANGARPSRRITSGVGFEVDLGKQIIIATTGGKLSYILNTSTGSGKRYYSGGRWKTATTPRGDFSMYSLYSRGWQSGPLGSLYRPGYYDRGWAIHGSNSIPTYPASHGCCRISVGATDMLWTRSWFKKGRRVLVY
ncbi:L,D-transpeptidase family protein [Brachybacterium sp. FME24]|uniref:L,D-transpeptidase family protein n=1 Tax=Brachybacterium sp. FME24 TaxID=2742605 RepID=UPI001866C3EF|nr:L,D-transpeptidase family protein [Brachybacterium sp. FME24]